jgi:hypothetical protein
MIMKLGLFVASLFTLGLSLSSCSAPKEIRAPCNWEQRQACGKIVPLSHQEQL